MYTVYNAFVGNQMDEKALYLLDCILQLFLIPMIQFKYFILLHFAVSFSFILQNCQWPYSIGGMMIGK
jgi:hypothetical protein